MVEYYSSLITSVWTVNSSKNVNGKKHFNDVGIVELIKNRLSEPRAVVHLNSFFAETEYQYY